MQMPITLTVAASTTSGPISIDALKTGTVTVQSIATTSGAGGLVYRVDYTCDPITSTAINWFSSNSSNQSTNSIIAFTFPITAVRLAVSSGSSNMSVQSTILQSAA
jgi:hypothetical protein